MTVAEPNYDLVKDLMTSTESLNRTKLAEEFSLEYAKKGVVRNSTPTVYIIGAHPLYRKLQDSFQLEDKKDAVMAVIDFPEQGYLAVLRPGEKDVTYKRETFWKKLGNVMETEQTMVARIFRGTKDQVSEIARAVCSSYPEAASLRKLARKHNRQVAGNTAPVAFDPFEL